MIAQLLHISDFREFEKQSRILKKAFFTKSYIATFTTRLSLKSFIQRALFVNYIIIFSQVQTDISIRYCFCSYSYGRKNKSLCHAKARLVALKGRERDYFAYYSGYPLKSQLLWLQKLNIPVRSLKKLRERPDENFHKWA